MMKRSVLVPACLLSLVALGCEPSAPQPKAPESAALTARAEGQAPASQPAPSSQPAPAPQATGAAGERAFGAPLSAAGEPVDVAQILSTPAPYLGKSVKARGVVARVCEKAGCWLELGPSKDVGGLRVPMADHAFFIPQDAVGREAVVEGDLRELPLTPDHKAHLESEGAKAVGPLALNARGVVVR